MTLVAERSLHFVLNYNLCLQEVLGVTQEGCPDLNAAPGPND
jgi:hypothetical protein